MESVEAKIIRATITGLLHLAGRFCPVFIEALLNELHSSNKTKKIINNHYVNHIKFEAIPDLLSNRCEIRQVFKIHKEFIENLYQAVITCKRHS